MMLADESSDVTVRTKLFRDFNLLAAGWYVMEQLVSGVCRLSCRPYVPCGRQQSSRCEEGRYQPVGVHCPSSLV